MAQRVLHDSSGRGYACSITCFDALGDYTSLSLVNGWEERLVDESELSRDEKEIVGVFRERGEICMAEVEKLLRRKDVYVAVRALLEKEIIGIKESVDDLFKPKIERLVRWKQKFAKNWMGFLIA